MTVEIIDEEVTFVTPLIDTADIIVFDEETLFINTSLVGTFTQAIINKVWDTAVGGGSWVHWETSVEDTNGSQYPYPSNWGVTTSMYRVESKIYSS